MTQWQGNIAKITLPTPFAVGDVNVYAVKGEALTLIDTGARTKESREALNAGLKELGLTLADFEQAVLTHHHPDHAGGLDFLSSHTKVYGHRLNGRWLNVSEEFVGQLTEFFTKLAAELGVPRDYAKHLVDYRGEDSIISRRGLDGVIADGEQVPGLPEFRAVESKGHAQSHLAFYREKDGIMIGGDHLLAKVSPNPIMEPPAVRGEERPKPLLQYNQALKRWLDFPISKVYSGHGADIMNVPELISYRLERQHDRAMQVKAMLEEKPLTGLEVCMRLFPKVFRKEFGLTLSETVGQLDYLEDLGLVKREKGKEEAVLYSAV